MDIPESFQRTALLLGEGAVPALARTRVAVFGVGGVGGWCAEALVRSGIGHLTIVDDDRVVLSNINRQLPATMRTVGRLKTDILRERFLDINPDLSVDALAMRYTPETAASFALDTFDFVIDAIDSVPCKAHLIRAATSLPSLTLLSSMGAAGRTDPSRIRISVFGKVQGDGLARAVRRCLRRDGVVPDFTCVWSDEPARQGSFMPVTAAFGLHLASLVLSSAGRLPQAS